MKRFVTLLFILLCLVAPQLVLAADCSNTSVALTPLNDLAGGNYLGFAGGLYPGGNVMPEEHLQEGLAAGQAVERLTSEGMPGSNGKIVLLSIGMSNTKKEFAQFMSLARTQSAPGVVLINGAEVRHDAQLIADPDAAYWTAIDNQLANRNLSRLQVQVVWLKQAIMKETDQFPADAQELQGYLRDTVLILNDRFPNLRAIYFSSRTYGGYATNLVSREPWAYQGAFAVKWLVEAQITGNDPALAYHNAPWLAWGPYLWADGLTPRSDGLTWACGDFNTDGIHPSASGQLKVAHMLLNFFRTDPTTPWFRPTGG